MGFRRRLALFLVITLAIIQGLTALSVYTVTRRTLIDQGKAQLVAASALLARQLDEIGDQIASGVRILSLDFALRQAIAGRDDATVASALRNHGRRVGATRMMLIGLDGKLNVDTLNAEAIGTAFAFTDLIDDATVNGRAASLVVLDGVAYRLVVVPVAAPEPIAFIAAGVPVNDGLLTRVQSMAGLPKAIAIAARRGGAWDLVAASAGAAALAEQLPRDGALPRSPTMAELGNRETLMLAMPLATPANSSPVVAVLGYSVSEALQAYRPILGPIIALLLLGLIVALIGAVLIARSVARPIEALAAATRRIEAGDYAPPVLPDQKDEIGQLGTALGHMARAIAEREERIRIAAAEAERAAALEIETRTLAQLGEVGTEITGLLDGDAIFATLHRHLGALLDAPVLLVLLLNRAGDALDLRYGVDAAGPIDLPPVRLDASDSGAAEAARQRRDILVEAPPPARPSALYGPLMAGEQLQGVLSVQSDRPGAYGGRELLIFRSLCAYGAVALANAAAYRDLQRALTTVRETQAQLLVTEKMAAMGQLTAGIAHEIQNPLNFINNFSVLSEDLLAELAALPPGAIEEAQEITGLLTDNLRTIATHGNRAAAIVRSMVQHSQSGDGTAEPTDLLRVLRQSVKAVLATSPQREQAAGVAITWDIEADLPDALVVAQDFFTVFSNLLRNAIYAVDARRAQAPPTYQPAITLRLRRRLGEVEVIIRDNGTGMSAATKQKLFTPFFTTKPTGQGTGFGLSLSYDLVVRRHRGRLEFNSLEGVFTEALVAVSIAEALSPETAG